jgi:hypothetical protein
MKAILRYKGGPGSGNFGHAGIPGQQGGSASGGGGKSSGARVRGATRATGSLGYREQTHLGKPAKVKEVQYGESARQVTIAADGTARYSRSGSAGYSKLVGVVKYDSEEQAMEASEKFFEGSVKDADKFAKSSKI